MKNPILTEGGAVRPRARTTALVTRDLPEEVLVYDLHSHQACCLNKTAALIWKECNGTLTVPEIAQTLSQELRADVKEDVVWLALQQLSRFALLEKEIAAEARQVSRRQALRKIGLTGLAAPMIITIVAPTAVQAITCGATDNDANQNADGCPCQGADDCASNCCGFTAAPGNICVTPNSVPSGFPCRANCECASNSCPATTDLCA